MGPQTLTTLRAGTPIRIGDITIVPVEKLHVTVGCDDQRLYADAGKRAAAVVVRDARGTRAVDDTGKSLDLEDLVEQAVGLRDVL